MLWRKKKTEITAKELMKRLERNPDFVARRAKKLEEHARRAAPVLEMEKEVLSDLAQRGVEVPRLSSLGDRNGVSPDAVDVLLAWLSRTDDPDKLVALVAPLAAAAQPFDGTDLANVFDSTNDYTLRWTIANAIACSHPTGLSEWLEARLGDSSLGRAREMLAIAAGKMLEPSVANRVLRKVFPELPGHCAIGLGECGGQEELAFLAIELNKHSGWVRKEIKKAINKISRREAGRGTAE